MRIALSALLVAGLLTGCTTPYNNMSEPKRLASFRAQCSSVGHAGPMLEICTRDMEEQFKRQRNRDVAVGVAVVAVGALAILAARNGGGGASEPPYPGNCKYDWQYDAAGHRCGHRSAYSRPGGYQ